MYKRGKMSFELRMAENRVARRIALGLVVAAPIVYDIASKPVVQALVLKPKKYHIGYH